MTENLNSNHPTAKTLDEVFQEVSGILVRSVAHDKEVTMDSRVAEDFGADSLDQIELVMELEKQFSCTISDEETAKIKTVGDIVQLIARLNEGKA